MISMGNQAGISRATELLSLENSSLCVRGSSQVLLEIPELRICSGERLVVTGPSGSGKSLLLSMITGRWAAQLEHSGTRTIGCERIGYIPQRGQDALHPLMPLGRQLRKASGRSAQAVADILASVGLDDPQLLQRRPAELSGGQAQRAAVALAALSAAPLILADEPTSALDQASRDKILGLLDKVVSAEQAMVVVTHDPEVAEALATRRIRLDSGKLREELAPARQAVPA